MYLELVQRGLSARSTGAAKAEDKASAELEAAPAEFDAAPAEFDAAEDDAVEDEVSVLT